MADFSPSCSVNCYGLPPSSINMVKPGKRPLSSMTPTVVVNSSSGRVRLVIGAAGGIRITTSTVYVTELILLIIYFFKIRNKIFHKFKIPADNGNCAFFKKIKSNKKKKKAMIRNLWLGEDIKGAIDSPRFHHQLFPMTLNYEKGLPKVCVYIRLYPRMYRDPCSYTDTITNGQPQALK